MFLRLGAFVSRHWLLVIFTWLIVLAGVRGVAPRWDDVTYDGDLAFLPPEMPSVRGEQLARAAFPNTRAKSQIVIIAARKERPLDPADFECVDIVASRFHARLGTSELKRAENDWQVAEASERTGDTASAEQARQRAQTEFESALAAYEEALRLDENAAPTVNEQLSFVNKRLGEIKGSETIAPPPAQSSTAPQASTDDSLPPGISADLPLVDVWSRHHEVFGSKLRSEDRHAQLIVLQLTNEFMATENIRVLQIIEQELQQVREQLVHTNRYPAGLELGISGSAAVGGDMLRAAAESIRHTEILTILLVIAILLVVYRSPFVIIVPLITIGVSLAMSTSLLALLTQLHLVPGFGWFDFKIFKTTKIFIIVILFGSGTDFCLFLVARLREELRAAGRITQAIGTALSKVGDSILASALTTVFGLATMFFADFGKFSNSGPAIGLCLMVTVAACLTLSPALLCLLGKWVFWPKTTGLTAGGLPSSDGRWAGIADSIVRRPAPILLLSIVLLSPLAVVGWGAPRRVTFDLLSELGDKATSIQGSEMLMQHFPVGEGGPVVVLVRQTGAGFDDPDKDRAAKSMAALFELTTRLSHVEGVDSVRSIAEPLGDPPEAMSLITAAGRRKLFLRQHPLTKSIFFSETPPYRGEVTRLEIVLDDNPFSLAAIETLARIDDQLSNEATNENSFWRGAEFLLTGTTAGIRDLRFVTQSDYSRITILVTGSVFAVILILLRRPLVCVYLILSVLFSYLVTIGGTELFFRWLYGQSFVGLDWKVPIFLFVILVAVGEDYNIYLVTRVFEEQQRLGPFAGLREAMMRTGGIITSCGLIMAGSFVSMIAGSLRGIVELGVALTCGILLDTLVVRSLLVPAFLAIVFRFRPTVRRPDAKED